MKIIIQLLNEMKNKEIIKDYAIGGATALIYYFEPIQTQDIDVFVFLKQSNSILIDLSPIYNFMNEKGALVKKEYIVINNTPVQFLIPYNLLIEKAIQNAVEVKYEGETVRIFSLEYLMAIMVQTKRNKDKARLEDILKCQISFDNNLFMDILKKNQLLDQWNYILKELDL